MAKGATYYKDPRPTQTERVVLEGKGDLPQRVNRSGKTDLPGPRTSEGAKPPVKPAPKPKVPVKPRAPQVIRTAVAERPTPVTTKAKPAFKGNWTGAAPSAMQARGGARIDRGGGLLGMIKRKMGK